MFCSGPRQLCQTPICLPRQSALGGLDICCASQSPVCGSGEYKFYQQSDFHWASNMCGNYWLRDEETAIRHSSFICSFLFSMIWQVRLIFIWQKPLDLCHPWENHEAMFLHYISNVTAVVAWMNVSVLCFPCWQLLLEAGADVEGGALLDAQESSAETPLQLAAAAGILQRVRLAWQTPAEWHRNWTAASSNLTFMIKKIIPNKNKLPLCNGCINTSRCGCFNGFLEAIYVI